MRLLLIDATPNAGLKTFHLSAKSSYFDPWTNSKGIQLRKYFIFLDIRKNEQTMLHYPGGLSSFTIN